MSHPALILILLTAALASADESPVVGAVLSVSGPVYLRSGGHVVEVRLRPLKDVLRVLRDGESLRCGASGKALIRLNGQTKTITASDGILHLKIDSLLTKPQIQIVEALHDYGRPGGSRGAGSFVWSPPNGGAVRVANLKIRWKAAGIDESLTLKVSTDAGEVIWSAADIDAGAGRVRAAQEQALRAALAQRQNDSEPEGIILAITSRKQAPYQVAFWVLSKQAEQRVEGQLKQWDEDESDPLLRAVARAHTLNNAMLYAEAAEEYATALAVAPKSETLLRAAIEANLRTGNVTRAHELREKLTAGSH